MKLIFFFFLLVQLNLSSQSYTSCFIGHSEDLNTNPEGGTCLMGGGRTGVGGSWENWFVKEGILNISESEALDCEGVSTIDEGL